MTEPPYERHPLDADPDEGEEAVTRSTATHAGRDITKAYRPLLNASKYTLIGSAAVVFLSGVAVSNAQANSPMESIAGTINRLSIMVLLCGFIMLLASYRIPHLPSFSMGGHVPIDRPVFSRFHGLLLANGLLLVLIWGLLIVTPANLFGLLFTVASAIMVIATGLMVTMIVFNTGWPRAYAIGVLVGIVPVLFWGLFSMRMLPMWNSWQMTLTAGILFSLSPLTGVACAAYVVALQSSLFGLQGESLHDRSRAGRHLADHTSAQSDDPG